MTFTQSDETPDAVYVDGRDKRERRVSLRFGPTLEISEDGVLLAAWPYADIRAPKAPGDVLRLWAVGAPPHARLDIQGAATQAEARRNCRMLEGEKNPYARGSRKVLLWTAIGGLAAIGLIWAGIPYAADRITPLIPASWEKKLGDIADSDVQEKYGGKSCDAPAGLAALNKLSRELQDASRLRIPAMIVAVSSIVPNAFALPGGKVYLFSGLLDKAQRPDEIAGVLAHELGHVEHRDHLRRMIAEGGVAYLFGLLLGDASGGGAVIYVGKTLLNARHSREVESAADAFAAQTMARLKRPSKAMGDLLLRITGPEEGGLFTILHDHPLSEDRLAKLAAADTGASGPPLLTDAEWAALKKICD